MKLTHGYVMKHYQNGAQQVSKPRPYDDAEYYWAVVDNDDNFTVIKCGKVINIEVYEELTDISDFLEMINSTIKPRIVHN